MPPPPLAAHAARPRAANAVVGVAGVRHIDTRLIRLGDRTHVPGRPDDPRTLATVATVDPVRGEAVSQATWSFVSVAGRWVIDDVVAGDWWLIAAAQGVLTGVGDVSGSSRQATTPVSPTMRRS
jgi:hypothetical protein